MKRFLISQESGNSAGDNDQLTASKRPCQLSGEGPIATTVTEKTVDL